jgi:hypothetical protein
MKLTTIFNNTKSSTEHQSLIAGEEVKSAETLSPRDRALEQWESRMDQGKPIARYPVSPRAQAHQIAALSSLPVAINAI